MEASTLTHASRGGLLGRRSPLLKLQGDERLVAMIRGGHERAFEVLFERYNSRLLAFCRHMLRSTEDAEDVLQEVFVKAHGAMLADERPINVRPWLYRIARNRCLNHLRKPVPDGQDSMDVMVGENGVTTADRVQKREDFRALVADVQDLPETQRTALLLRELDALSYEEIAVAMDTTVPAVKSLLVRARMSLAEATHSRLLTCGEVRLELAEAAEGLRKATGPARHHIKRCDPCRAYRTELRSNTKALASLAPIGPLALIHQFLIGKLSGSGGAAGGTAAGGSAVAGGTAAGTGAVATAGAGAGTGAAAAVAGGGGGAFAGGAAAAGGIGGAIGAKAAATAATAALLTAGAVEVRNIYGDRPIDIAAKTAVVSEPPQRQSGGLAAEPPTIDVVATGASAIPAIEPAVEPGPAEEAAASEQAATPAEEPVQAAAPLTDELAAAPPTLVDQLQQGVVGPPAASDSVVGDPDGGAGGSAVLAEPTPAPASAPPATQPPASGASPSAPPEPTPAEAPPASPEPVTPAPAPASAPPPAS